MKISKKTVLVLGGMFSISALGLMFVSADKNLYTDLNNAVQHIPQVKIISTGNNSISATMRKVGNNMVGIDTNNFILSQTGNKKNTIDNTNYSSILGGKFNKIENGSHDVIIGGSGNLIKGTKNYNAQYNTIIGGTNNKVEGNLKYNTIAGGKNNSITSGNSSVIVGGYNNNIEGNYSVIMGFNSSVTGDNSVALGSGSKIKANNSFLWSDGNKNETLEANDVFAINAQSGVVINTSKAHNIAKLTLGGALILSHSDNQSGIVCGIGQGGGIFKIEESDNHQLCLCGCDGSGWNSMFSKGMCLSVCNQSIQPKCGKEVDRSCTPQGIIYSGSCDEGKAVEGTGAYFVDKNNKVHRSCQTYDGQVASCSGNVNTTENISDCIICPKGSLYDKDLKTCVCDGDQVYDKENNKCYCPTGKVWSEKRKRCMDKQKQANCPDLTDTNGHWENPQFTQTWNEEFNMYTPIPGLLTQPTCDSNSSAPCSKYACNDHYSCNNGTCKADTQTGKCQGNPENSHWVVSQFTQTWSGGLNKRYPETKIGTYTSDTNSKVECSYTCDNHYTRDGNKCNPDTLICDGTKPTHELYHTYGSGTYVYGTITETGWNYTTNSKPGACQFTCINNNYEYSGTQNSCIPKALDCTGTKPSGNGYKLGSGTYVYGTTNKTSWDYTVNNNPGRCQFTCNEGYKRNSQTNKCEQTIPSPVCGKEQYTCSESEPANEDEICIDGSSFYGIDGDRESDDGRPCKSGSTLNTRQCTNLSKTVNCTCESEKYKICPDGYMRDNNKKLCKYMPRFCMLQENKIYDPNYEKRENNDTIFYYPCFNLNFKEKTRDIGNPSRLPQDNTIYSDDYENRNLLVGSSTPYYQSYLFIAISKKYNTNLYPILSLDTNKVERVSEDTVNDQLSLFINEGNCKLIADRGTNGYYLDCNVDNYPTRFYKDIQDSEYPYCGQDSYDRILNKYGNTIRKDNRSNEYTFNITF